MGFFQASRPRHAFLFYKFFRKEMELVGINVTFFCFAVTKILQACDRLRDDSLPELGVKLEDVEG